MLFRIKVLENPQHKRELIMLDGSIIEGVMDIGFHMSKIKINHYALLILGYNFFFILDFVWFFWLLTIN